MREGERAVIFWAETYFAAKRITSIVKGGIAIEHIEGSVMNVNL